MQYTGCVHRFVLFCCLSQTLLSAFVAGNLFFWLAVHTLQLFVSPKCDLFRTPDRTASHCVCFSRMKATFSPKCRFFAQANLLSTPSSLPFEDKGNLFVTSCHGPHSWASANSQIVFKLQRPNSKLAGRANEGSSGQPEYYLESWREKTILFRRARIQRILEDFKQKIK